jgi:hypothetical protein
MNLLIQKSSPVNGSVSGRGFAHRKLSLEQSVGLAADVATGQRRFEPSLAQLSSLFGDGRAEAALIALTVANRRG